MFKKHPVLVMCLALALLLVAGAVVIAILEEARTPFTRQPFDRSVWLAQTGSSTAKNSRGLMAEDLRRHHLPVGLSRAQVRTLLGPPDAGTPPSDAPPSPSDGSRYSYNLGHWRCPFCMTTLDIVFDNSGKLTHVDIVGH